MRQKKEKEVFQRICKYNDKNTDHKRKCNKVRYLSLGNIAKRMRRVNVAKHNCKQNG